MDDPEIAAIQKCTEGLNGLEDEAKIRVLQYLINRFKLTGSHQPSFSVPTNANNGRPPLPDSTNTGDAATGNAKVVFNKAHPSLRDIVIKNYPKSETEWILVYSYYASQFGEKDFALDEVLSLYDQTKRLTENNRKNFRQNLGVAVRKDWIRSTNETDYIMLEGGITYVNEILNGNSTRKQRKPIKRKRPDPSEKGISK